MTAATTANPASSTRATLLALAAGNFMVGVGAFVVLGLMSTITRSLGVDPADGAKLMTYYAVAYAIGSPLLVATTGRWPRRQALTVAMTLVALGSLGCAFAPTLGGMELARIVTAFGAGLYSPATAAVAVSLVPAEQRGWALSLVFMGFTAAQGIGNPIGAWLGYAFGWQSAFLAVGALSAVMAAALWRVVPASTPFQPSSLADLGRILKTPHMLVALLFTVFFVASTYTTSTYITLILEQRLGLSGNGIALVLAIYGGMAFVAATIGGLVADRAGASRALLAYCVLQLILLPLVTQGPQDAVFMTMTIAAWSLFGWSHFTAQQSRLVSIDPPQAQLLLAMNSSMLYVGIAIGSLMASQLLPIADFKGIAAGAVASIVIAAFVLWAGDRMVAHHKTKSA